MKFFKHALTIVALFTISPVYIKSAATKSRRSAPAKVARTRTAQKTPVKRSPVKRSLVVQQPRTTPFTYNQILSSLRTITPTNADYTTLLNIRAEIDQQLALQNIVQKINNLDDTILDTMENAGGHAIARHIDQSHSDMVLRLLRENIEATSTFTDKTTAIKAVKENLRNNAEKITSWLVSNTGLNTKEPFYYTHAYPIGQSLVRGKENTMHPAVKSIVVLVTDPTNDLGFRIITAYPTHR